MRDPGTEKDSPLKTSGDGPEPAKGQRIIHVGDKTLTDMSPEDLAAEKKRLHDLGEVKRKEKAEAFARDGMSVRSDVHHASLYIEEYVNNLFEVVFGEETARMDFGVSTRARMLKSMRLITEDQLATLSNFIHLRNKFIHSKEFNSYTAYFSAHGGHRERVMKLIEEEMAKKAYRAKGPEEAVLGLGVAILIDRAWDVCKALGEATIERGREPIYRRLFDRVHREIGGFDGPFQETANNLPDDPNKTYTQREVRRVIDSVSLNTARYFVKVWKEEKNAYHRELFGVDLPEETPPTAPATEPTPASPVATP